MASNANRSARDATAQYERPAIPLPYYDTPTPRLLRHCHVRHACRGKMAQKRAKKSANFLSVIDFNEKKRQVSSLLTLYK